MYFFSFSVNESANCSGVRPEACTSLSNGREILPSGRTGKVAVRSGFFPHGDVQNILGTDDIGRTALTGRSCGRCERATILSEAGLTAAWAGASCADAMLPNIRIAATACHIDFIIFSSNSLLVTLA